MEKPARKLLQELVDTPAPVGSEEPAVKLWCKYLKPYADEVFTDSYGNGFAVLNPQGDPAVLFTGHADELGLMVTYIDDDGFLWVDRLGGYDAKVLPALRVKVLAKDGPLPGVIGALPPHMQGTGPGQSEFKRYQLGENVYVDIGAKNKKQAQKLVRVGDPIIVDYGLIELNDDIVVGRGLDNKIGIVAAAEGLRRCREQAKQLNAKVVAMATVQEEIGSYGAAMGAFRIEPDVALAVDVTQSLDIPNVEKKRWGEVKLGLGPVLAHGSACHPRVVARLEELAGAREMKLQHEAAPRATGTDADSIFTTKAGIPTAVVSLAQRYMHSPAELVNLADLEQICDLVAAFALDLKKGERFTVAL